MIFVFGHRGATGNAPENTIAAFAAAAQLGADGVELDVRAAADGSLVVHHDPVLPSGAPIAELSRAALPPAVPLLDAALEACAGLRVHLEVKNLPTEPGYDPDAAVAVAAVRTVVEHGRAADVVVSSFDLRSIDVARAAAPHVATAWLTLAGYDQLGAVATAAARGHSGLNPHDRGITADVVDAAHAAGLAVTAWTVNDAGRMRELAAMGVDGLITDDVPLALSVLRPA